jgi:hypothetical protein
VHDVHVAGEVGATSEPHVVTGPASQPVGGAGGPLPGGVDAPQASLFGTQTLTCSPAKLVSRVHVVLEPHSSPLGHAGAQNVSP